MEIIHEIQTLIDDVNDWLPQAEALVEFNINLDEDGVEYYVDGLEVHSQSWMEFKLEGVPSFEDIIEKIRIVSKALANGGTAQEEEDA